MIGFVVCDQSSKDTEFLHALAGRKGACFDKENQGSS
jgi:hypothetical protein